MPICSDLRPGRAFRKDANKLARQFASEARSTNDLDALASQTLETLTRLAVDHGEDRYTARYEKARRALDEDGS